MDLIEKITLKIDFPTDQKAGCWIWHKDASRTTTGVPRVKYRKEWVPVRRALYVHYIGPIPESQMVKQPNIRMGCGNPDCVNPHHARVITDFDRLVTQHERDVYRLVTQKDPQGRTTIKQRFRKRAGIAAKLIRKELGRDPTLAEFRAAFYAALPDNLNPYSLAARDLESRKLTDPTAVTITARDYLDAYRVLGLTTITAESWDAVGAMLHGDDGTRPDV